MSLTLMAPSAWRYYAEEVATGREDYYALGAERPGRFVGRGAELLGIEGEAVSALAMERLFGYGQDPRDGSPLGRGFSPDDKRAVAGFALTFSPPKTVSVLWALGDEKTSEAVSSSHDAAVEAAMRFLDDHASFTRRGHCGVHQVDTDGLLAASFVHRTSRAADPQLHTHVLVANKVRAEDGAWLSLDGRELFETQKAAGMLYKAALRAELTSQTGVRWTDVDDNGVAEIAGVPALLAEYWSERRKQLKAAGDELIAKRSVELGRSLTRAEQARCFQVAAYQTRTPKADADTPTAVLRERWADEARSWNLGPERWLRSVLRKPQQVAAQPAEAIVPTVLARLEDRAATFGRADVVEEASRLLVGENAESTRELIEALANVVLAERDVLSLAGPLPLLPLGTRRRKDGMTTIERHGAVRFTTGRILRQEAAILEVVAAGRETNACPVPVAVVDAVLSESQLGEDQRQAVRGLLIGGAQVALLVGPAGAGKSRALAAAREAWNAAGYRTLGLAPSAMAASVLREEAGIASETLAKFVFDLEKDVARSRLDGSTIVVLDESGMARTDDLAKLVAAASSARAKLVLVGDPHQLGAVGPGGMFRTVVDQFGALELETVRRFSADWEASASLRLRARDTSVLSAYHRHGRIEDGSRPEMLDRAHQFWHAAREENRSVVLTANDNETADELARRCRADRIRRGEVEQQGVAISSGVAGRNDEVVTLRNDRRLRLDSGEFVRNGARWKVMDARDDGSLVVEPISGPGRVLLPEEYVRRHVGLAYALTVHKAQGLTVDRSYVLVDQKMTAAQLYVAMSRGRETNVALVCSADDAFEDHVRRPSVEAIELLRGVMCRDDVDRSAHEVMRARLSSVEPETSAQNGVEQTTRTVDHRSRIEPDFDHFEFFAPPPDVSRQEGPVLRP